MVSQSNAKKKIYETIKQELLYSLMDNNEVEESGLDDTANATNSPAKAILIIKRYEKIIKRQNKRDVIYVGKDRQLLKGLKEAELFFEKVGQNKPTIYFKTGLYKLLMKYTVLQNCTLSSND